MPPESNVRPLPTSPSTKSPLATSPGSCRRTIIRGSLWLAAETPSSAPIPRSRISAGSRALKLTDSKREASSAARSAIAIGVSSLGGAFARSRAWFVHAATTAARVAVFATSSGPTMVRRSTGCVVAGPVFHAPGS